MLSKRGLVMGVISALFVGEFALFVQSAAGEKSITSPSDTLPGNFMRPLRYMEDCRRS